MSTNKTKPKDAVTSHNILGVGLTDEPAVVDSLGCDKYCEGLAEFVTNCPTPMTIAIQGGWGTGKSTIMKIMQDKIKDKAITLEFNTWKYARSAGKMLTLPLLLDFVSRLDEAGKKDNDYKQKFMSKDVAEKCKNTIYGIFGAAVFAGQGVIEHFTGAGGAIEKFEDAYNKSKGEKLTDEDYNYFRTSDNIRELISERLDYLCGGNPTGQRGPKNQKNMVVFVDDLDRLNPIDAVNLLEDIKNILSLKRCVFVLALDNEIVEQGLREKFGESVKAETAQKFFDKIIQLPFNLPVQKYDIGSFLETLNEGERIGNSGDIKGITEVIELFKVKNPRTIKRALNTLILYSHLDDIYTKHKKESLSIFLLQTEHKEVYSKFVKSYVEYFLDKDVERYFLKGEFENFWEDMKGYRSNKAGTSDSWTRNIEILQQVFGEDYTTLRKIILESAMVGESSLEERQADAAKTMDYLEEYVKELFPGVKETKKGHGFDTGAGEIFINSPSNDKAHTNLTFKSKSNEKLTDINIQKKDNESLEEITRRTGTPAYHQTDVSKTEFCILTSKPESICFKAVSLDNLESLKVAGEALRRFKDGKDLFSEV